MMELPLDPAHLARRHQELLSRAGSQRRLHRRDKLHSQALLRSQRRSSRLGSPRNPKPLATHLRRPTRAFGRSRLRPDASRYLDGRAMPRDACAIRSAKQISPICPTIFRPPGSSRDPETGDLHRKSNHPAQLRRSGRSRADTSGGTGISRHHRQHLRRLGLSRSSGVSRRSPP